MKVYITSDLDFLKDYKKKSLKFSELRNIDPLYILDMVEFQFKKDDDNFDLKFIVQKEIEFILLENDWIPVNIKRRDFEDLLKRVGKEESRLLKSNYVPDEYMTYYILMRKSVDEEEINTKELLEIFTKNGFNTNEKFFKVLSRNAGMYYYCKPKSNIDLQDHLARITNHYMEISKYEENFKVSFLYAGTINRIDYGISIVNKNRMILYANWIRRRFHGDDILGKYCYKVFPDIEIDKICDSCVMKKLIDEKKGSLKNFRCEVHKLRKSRGGHPQNKVYFVSETASLLEIRNKIENKIERLGINVVRDNTSRIISQEFLKIAQRLSSFHQIITLLKFSLLGGTERDFKEEFQSFFKEDKEFFNRIVEKISYFDVKSGKRRILSFGFGRFRYYRNVVDIFDKNFNKVDNSKKHILQIYDAYNENGQMKKLIGKSLDFHEIGKYLINRLEFDLSGQFVDHDVDFIKKIKDKQEVIDYITEIGLLKQTGDSQEIEKWYDIELSRGDELIGYISVDWVGKKFKNDPLRYETLRRLNYFLNFVNKAILRIADYKYIILTRDLNSIISGEYETEEEMYYDFSNKLCDVLKVLKCEIYQFSKKGKIERRYLCYSGLDKNKSEKANEKLERTHNLGEHLIGNSMKLILESTSDEIYWKCINILDYDRYDRYYKLEPKKQVCSKYKKMEEDLISKPDYLGKRIDLRNSMVAPIIYRGTPIGAIRITNNLFKGKIYSPIIEQRILYDVAYELGVKINNHKLKEREKKIFNIFTELSELLTLSEKRFGEKDVRKEIRKEVVRELAKVVEPDNVLYFLVKKDEGFQKYLELQFPDPMADEYKLLRKVYKSLPPDFKFKKMIFKLLEKSDPDNNEDMEKNFYDSNETMICRRIDENKEPYSIILFFNDNGNKFEKADMKVTETIAEQVEAILTIRALKRQSEKIMQNVAHQIISPMKGLETHCNNLRNSMLPINNDNYFLYNSDDRKRYVLDLLLSQTSHVRFIASNYQQFLNFDLGKEPILDITEFSLISVLKRTVSIYQPIAKSQGIKNIEVFHDGGKYYMTGDENLLLHIFVCLTDNALKYSDKNRSIKITVSEKDDFYYVKTQSWGLLIEDSDRKKVFEREFRTQLARKRFSQGSGIGLYIVGKICDFIQGRCYVEESSMEKGTIITAALPITFNKKRRFK